MNSQKCSKGHFYDADKFESCPHCSSSGAMVSEPVTMSVSQMDNQKTVANTGASQPNSSISLSDAITVAGVGNTQPDDDTKTISYYNKSVGVEPVVGWMVCVEGNYFGQSFNLKSGRNFIGRSFGMNIVLKSDNSVSRERHAVVVYDPRSRMFLAQPGDSRELFYLNDDVVLSNVELKANDILSIGNTKLMFVPFCTRQFAWEDIEKKE